MRFTNYTNFRCNLRCSVKFDVSHPLTHSSDVLEWLLLLYNDRFTYIFLKLTHCQGNRLHMSVCMYVCTEQYVCNGSDTTCQHALALCYYMAITASFGTSMILQPHGAHVIYQLQHMLQLQLTDVCKYDVNYLNSTATSFMDCVSPQIKAVNGGT